MLGEESRSIETRRGDWRCQKGSKLILQICIAVSSSDIVFHISLTNFTSGVVL